MHEVGGLRVDLRSDEVTAGDTRLLLTPSEFKILALLASDAGTAFSRRQILERLWGGTHAGDENTCEVHVSSLRRKLSAVAGEHRARIETVRGIGYKLVES